MHAHPSKRLKHAEKKKVLTTAFIRATEHLELTRQEISSIIGLSEATLSRVFNKKYALDPLTKEAQLALLFLRLYRNLDALFGGNQKQCQLWLRSENTHLHTSPIALIKSIEGLILVLHYLDAMRGKN